MRRSDEEFKIELMRRAEEYRMWQRRKRANGLRMASMAVMVCVLIVVVPWVQLGKGNWQWSVESSEPGNSEPESSEPESTRPESESGVGTGWPENAEGVLEGDNQAEEIRYPVGLSVQRQGDSLETEETERLVEYLEYPDEQLAMHLLIFLNARMIMAGESAEGEDESGEAVEESIRETYRITIHYEDGDSGEYLVIRGNEELKIEDSKLVLDQKSWNELNELLKGE